jgi:hypothetical protein
VFRIDGSSRVQGPGCMMACQDFPAKLLEELLCDTRCMKAGVVIKDHFSLEKAIVFHSCNFF